MDEVIPMRQRHKKTLDELDTLERSLRRAAAQHQLKDTLQPRVAAAEAVAGAALLFVQHWTAWAAIEAIAEAASHPEPGSAEQLQAVADMTSEALANGAENIRTMWQAWEQLDAALITWSGMAGIKRDAA